jgi:hypothetical protein
MIITSKSGKKSATYSILIFDKFSIAKRTARICSTKMFLRLVGMGDLKIDLLTEANYLKAPY